MRYKEKLNLDFEYLPTPIDTEMFKNIPDVEKSQNQIVYIGRDSFEKGIDILRKIESQVNGNVIYCINKPWKETMKILKSSTILVVPSRIESLPTVIEEAQYLKTPVIAFSVGGIPELIKNNETGLLVDEGNSKMFLDTINKLLDDETLQTKLSSKAFDDVKKRFTWKIVLPKYIQFYETLLSEN